MTNLDFERCVDFLARMIEKYGGELNLSNTEEQDKDITTDEISHPLESKTLILVHQGMSVLTDLEEAC